MFKKILSFALVVAMLMSVAMIAASAAQVEVTAEAADGVVEVGADADVAATEAANTISFDTNGSGWNNFAWIGFHIWAIDDDSFEGYDWNAKKQRGTDEDGDGVWTYDLDAAGLSFKDSCSYCVIFYNDNSSQTYNLLLGNECIGHTASCNGTIYENPVDSSKTTQAAFWDSSIDSSVYGPELAITSIGNVVGSAVPKSTSKYQVFVKFLASGGSQGLRNAVAMGGGKTAQEIIDATAEAFGLKKGDVKDAIKEAAEVGDGTDKYDASKDWDESKSKLSDGESEDAHQTPAGGNDGSGNDNNNANSGSKTNNKTTKTGQETTVLFIMLGVMAAAAGVIIFARKKETA